MIKTIDIQHEDIALATDIYETKESDVVLLSLIGRTSNRKKKHYQDLYTRLANELNITSIIFDYSGHGGTPGNLEEIKPAQHIAEVSQDLDVAKMNRSDNTYTLRRNPQALKEHPLLSNAKSTIPVLVMVHENDNQIPPQTTDAFAEAYNAQKIVIKDIAHSLDFATQEQVNDYNEILFNWLNNLRFVAPDGARD